MLHHPSTMIRKEFLFNHHIKYQNYPYAEDYKLWFEIAKAGGILFIEPQELMIIRKKELQIIEKDREKMHISSFHLRKEILLYLLSIDNNKSLNSLLINFDEVVRNKWMSNDDTYRIFINIFNKMFASFSI